MRSSAKHTPKVSKGVVYVGRQEKTKGLRDDMTTGGNGYELKVLLRAFLRVRPCQSLANNELLVLAFALSLLKSAVLILGEGAAHWGLGVAQQACG